MDFSYSFFLCEIIFTTKIIGVKMNDQQMKLTIVIPAHNEEESLPQTIKALEQEIKTPHEIIVIDDYSKDKTAEVTIELTKSYNNIRLIKNDMRPGFTNAIKKGFSQVNEGAIALVMADKCDQPSTVDDMYEKINEGYDIVCGSRYMKGGGRDGRPLQGFFSRSVGLALNKLIGIPTHDCSNAFKMYRKDVIDTIEIEEAGFASSLEITVKAFIDGFKITEVPTYWKKREAGESKFQISSVAKNYIYWFFWSIFKSLKRWFK